MAAADFTCDDVSLVEMAASLPIAGDGSTSRVVRMIIDGHVRAVKYFKSHPGSQELATREAYYLTLLASNPFVATLYRHCRDAHGVPMLILENMAGDSLTHVTNLPGLMLYRLALQLLEGLRRMHALGVIHHDIKPANIGLSRLVIGVEDETTPFVAKFFDFGHSCQPRVPGHPCLLAHATPLFFPPEANFRALNDEALTAMTREARTMAGDIHALGVTLLYAAGIDMVGVAGTYLSEHPYHEYTDHHNKEHVVWWWPLVDALETRWRGLKRDVVQVLQAMLQPHPVARPTAAEALARLRVVGEAHDLDVDTLLWVGEPPA
jgi:serine/threonine protein kinase